MQPCYTGSPSGAAARGTTRAAAEAAARPSGPPRTFGGPGSERESDMSVSLSKGGNVSLSKQAPGLTAALVGLGWDARTTSGADFDLDASALLVNMAGRVLSDQHFVFYNNL